MKANELRIGNWVYPFDDINLVDSKNILRDCIQVQPKDFENTTHLEPIPLTEEWLERFGFEKDEEYDEGSLVDYRWILMNGSLEFVSFWNSEELTGVNQPQTRVDIEHVHSLQNLYFAVTGKELTKNK